jgi:polyisoprenoid-binding protein YceI
MRQIALLFVLVFFYGTAFNQHYVTRNGVARFYSKTDLEDIAAENKQVLAILDPSSRSIAASILMRGFLFNKALMQEHFNENYVESDKYPKAVFEGVYTGPVDAGKNGTYNLSVNGKLTIHGVTREISLPAILEVINGVLKGKAEFQITPEDYKINIPSLVRDKISKKVDVFISFECKKQ